MSFFDFIRSLRNTSPRAAQARLDAATARIHGIPVAEAERAFAEEARAGTLFRIDPSPPSAAEAVAIAQLPPEARRFFEAYRSVETNSMQLSRDTINPYQRSSGWFKVGNDLEHADVIVSLAEGLVAIVEDNEAPSLDLSDTHPSLWHYLLIVSEMSQPA
jgi:hypothetical protein